MTAAWIFRRATAEDLSALTDLCMRSKAHWGYDTAFMRACLPEFTFRTSNASGSEIWLVDGPIAIVQVSVEGDKASLDKLFLEPSLIGQGLGRHSFEWARRRALSLGCSKMTIESDPNAAPFYEAMGASLVGSAPSGAILGRLLPLYEIALWPSDAEIAEALMDLAHRRGSMKSFCPSEVARALCSNWRSLMPEVRRMAATLPLQATQKGRPVDVMAASGPIRLSLR